MAFYPSISVNRTVVQDIVKDTIIYFLFFSFMGILSKSAMRKECPPKPAMQDTRTYEVSRKHC
jgi:hypothetical protein